MGTPPVLTPALSSRSSFARRTGSNDASTEAEMGSPSSSTVLTSALSLLHEVLLRHLVTLDAVHLTRVDTDT